MRYSMMKQGTWRLLHRGRGDAETQGKTSKHSAPLRLRNRCIDKRPVWLNTLNLMAVR